MKDFTQRFDESTLALAAHASGQALLGEPTTEADFIHLRAAELYLRRLERVNRVWRII
jgi:hypothetical protein